MLKFEWNEIKNILNKKKHGLSFDDALYVFYDDNALLLYDKNHSSDEDRFFQIGMIRSLNIVCVVFCVREEETIRIISARFATNKEKNEYERKRV